MGISREVGPTRKMFELVVPDSLCAIFWEIIGSRQAGLSPERRISQVTPFLFTESQIIWNRG